MLRLTLETSACDVLLLEKEQLCRRSCRRLTGRIDLSRSQFYYPIHFVLTHSMFIWMIHEVICLNYKYYIMKKLITCAEPFLGNFLFSFSSCISDCGRFMIALTCCYNDASENNIRVVLQYKYKESYTSLLHFFLCFCREEPYKLG